MSVGFVGASGDASGDDTQDEIMRLMDNHFAVKSYEFTFDVWIVYVNDVNTGKQDVLGVEMRITDYESIDSNCTNYPDEGFFPLQNRIKSCLDSYFKGAFAHVDDFAHPKIDLLMRTGSVLYRDSLWNGVVKFFPPAYDFENTKQLSFNDLALLKTQIGQIEGAVYTDAPNTDSSSKQKEEAEAYRGKYEKENNLFDRVFYMQKKRVENKELFTKKLGSVSFIIKCPVKTFMHIIAASNDADTTAARQTRLYTLPDKRRVGIGFPPDIALLNEDFFTRKDRMVHGKRYQEYKEVFGRIGKIGEVSVYDENDEHNFKTETGSNHVDTVNVLDNFSGDVFEAFLGFVSAPEDGLNELQKAVGDLTF